MVSMMLFSSCEKDFLNVDPSEGGSVSVDDVYSSFDKINLAMTGIYSSIANVTLGQVSYRGESYFNYMNDLFAGSVALRNPRAQLSNAYRLTAFEFYSTDVLESSYTWLYSYVIIRASNALLDAVNNFDVTTLDPEQIKRMKHIKAELLTLRGFNYFRLNSFYAWKWDDATAHETLSVPLVLTISNEGLPRESASKVMAQVEKDYLEALVLFDEIGGVYVGTLQEVAAANVNVLRMLLSRYYMYIEDYSNGLYYAEEVIQKSGKSLMGESHYYAGFNNSANPEWIWAGLGNSSGLGYNSFFAYFSSNFSNSYFAKGPYSIDLKYLNFISPNDVRKHKDIVTKTPGVFITDNDSQILGRGAQYYFDNGFTPSASNEFFDQLYTGVPNKIRQRSSGSQIGDGDILYMRLAEAYYLAAESAYLNEDMAKARQYLSDVIKPYNSMYILPTTDEGVYKAIKYYKLFDMYGEGRGFEDFKRRGDSVDRSGHPMDGLSVLKYGPNPSDPYPNIFTLQIPRNVLNDNTNLKPNIYPAN